MGGNSGITQGLLYIQLYLKHRCLSPGSFIVSPEFGERSLTLFTQMLS